MSHPLSKVVAGNLYCIKLTKLFTIITTNSQLDYNLNSWIPVLIIPIHFIRENSISHKAVFQLCLEINTNKLYTYIHI